MLCSIERCTGCMACLSSCPSNAITKIIDEEGFNRPLINPSLCTKCGICTKVCPEITKVNKKPTEQKVFACWSKDEVIRRESSSGGFFTEICKIVLKENGVIFGVTATENKEVLHIMVDNEQNLYKIRGSKYVQSDTTHIYEKVKKILDSGVKVLFSGTPCQIAGLYNYLRNDYKNLITIDLICHGVPSPMVYVDYINFLEKKYQAKMVDIKFRDKDKSWTYFNMKIQFSNNKVYNKGYFKDPYIVGFLKNNFLRPSCYQCRYANTNRISDITIGDFWGYKPTHKEDKNDDKGISLVILNSKKGKEYFERCKENLVYFPRTLDEAVRGNRCLSESFPKPATRDQFWKDYRELDFDVIIKKYMTHDKITFIQFIRSNFSSKYARFMLLPYRIMNKIKELF